MRQASVRYKGEPAGLLTQYDDGSFSFKYYQDWVENESKPAISLTLPKSETEYKSPSLFAFFFHLLPEGVNRQVISKSLRIDRSDDFGLLLNTANVDTIGAVTIHKIL